VLPERLVADNPPPAIQVVEETPAPGQLQFTNNPHVDMDYELLKVGSSGVEMVELWITRDDGRTWRRFAEDPDKSPPFTIDLPGEGVYGFHLIVRGRSGLGKPAPRSGDAPELRLEVDMTPPVGQLFAPEADPRREDVLVLLWHAADRNLTVHPITLLWSESAEGPWRTIAAGLPNTGRHSWTPPSDLPYQVYLRMETGDKAGNIGVTVTGQPVLVDLLEPAARLHGIQSRKEGSRLRVIEKPMD
jgi:hypothetical protein